LGRRRLLQPRLPPATHASAGVALFSYDGQLFWGFNADWDSLPDLHELVGRVAAEFRLLTAEAGVDSIGEPTTGTAASG
jgi:hypothetical protein